MKHRIQTKIDKLSKQVALTYTNAYQNIPKKDQSKYYKDSLTLTQYELPFLHTTQAKTHHLLKKIRKTYYFSDEIKEFCSDKH